jgi:hypothetical protein
VKRNCADCGVCGLFEADALWNTRDECLRNGDHLRVVRPSAATAGDAVAGNKALDTTADGLDDPRR